MIIVTISTDWAPPEVLKDTLDMLDKYNVKSTIFCTDDLKESIFPKTNVQHELAIHPNYDDVNFKDETDVCITNFPHAKGSRSHRLMYGTPIQNELLKNHIKYDSSLLFYGYKSSPFILYNNLVEIPMYWSDDVCVRIHDNDNFTPKILSDAILNNESVFVFNFHPIHVYLNTVTDDHYQKAKRFYHDPVQLSNHINEVEYGVRHMFEQLLSMVEETVHMKIINKAVRQLERGY